ncbi:MAG: NADH-quinone oxidoreductase subunit C [Candidatus Omnitrophota bacterium]|nr:NADH-quinone oxidoreductase subunit C [Candidatus Omnitrophota bacterium]
MRQSKVFELIKLKFPQVSEEDLTKAVIVPQELLPAVANYLKGQDLSFDNLHCITAVDRLERIELVYIFYSFKNRQQAIVKVYLPIDAAEVESLTKFYRSADWFEREVYDLFGVKFLNHPNLARILNPQDWKGYPLRKNYTNPNLIRKP